VRRLALVLLFALPAALTVWLAAEVLGFLLLPPESASREVTVEIAPGEGFEAIARRLSGLGLVRDPARFRLYAALSGRAGHVRAGEFRLETGWRPRQVLDALVRGPFLLHRLVVPEGLTWWQTGRLVEEAKLGSFESFERAVHDPALMSRFGLPGGSAEGYLFPETYLLPKPRGNDAREAVAAMLQGFRAAASSLWPGGLPEPQELRRLVILASLVEKETAQEAERARVAGVYANRLEAGWLLQCDPCVIYGLGPGFDGNLTRAQLEDPSNPYNTYRLPGLPPGPVCSPGLKALAAAAAPERHGYFFFVSRQDGHHQFSQNLDEHNRAVRDYQLRQTGQLRGQPHP